MIDHDLASRILYEDNHVLIINKRPGELSQGDRTGDPCLIDRLMELIKERDQKPGNVFLGLVHRLDRPTSGLLVFAKTSKALGRLNATFQERTVRKWYWLVLDGEPPQSEGELIHYLERREKANRSYAWAENGRNRQEARLRYRVLGKGERYIYVEVEILTGRHHQIRAQFAAIGLHIKGDLKYGAKRSNPDGGICLHAARLELPHPVSEQIISIVAPVDAVQSDGAWKGLPSQS